MADVILIYANCHNLTAKGDFTFAANIARDLVRELEKDPLNLINVILVSTLDGLSKFISLYGCASQDKISVEGTNIGLSALETFDAVENNVLVFIEANRCKFAPEETIKKILSPESKFMFIKNANQPALSALHSFVWFEKIKTEQPGLYSSFDYGDVLIGTAGFGEGRLGLPSIDPSSPISHSFMPLSGNYGFMYLARKSKSYETMAQYMKLARYDNYILVGEFTGKEDLIRWAFIKENTLASTKDLPSIYQYASLSNNVMRRMISNTRDPLVLTTGVTSTLEAIRDKKLPYYQDMSINNAFVLSYLLAVKMTARCSSFTGTMAELIITLSDLLFAEKPLKAEQMRLTRDLLAQPDTVSGLVEVNQIVLDRASGKIAPALLTFLRASRNTQDSIQLAAVCRSLRKPGETGSPVYDQALRRAATWGRLFELKVLIKALSTEDLDKKDPAYQRAALHWAVLRNNIDCARALVIAGASLKLQDKEGKTPLSQAISQENKPMIAMLLQADASIEIEENEECSSDSDSGEISLCFRPQGLDQSLSLCY